jgi:uncharacterized glyoxalase superfamily protein PhnB
VIAEAGPIARAGDCIYNEGGGALSFAVLSFGGSQIMFNAGGHASSQERREVDLYACTEHVDAIDERLKGRVSVVEGPHATFYGMREMTIRDRFAPTVLGASN